MEDEKGREDGCLWCLLEFFLNALQEVLQQLHQTLEHWLGYSLEWRERGEGRGR